MATKSSGATDVAKHERPYDIVLFGATGFAGELTARYLASHAPQELRWALAGRNAGKLAAVRQSLADLDPALVDLPLLPADAEDASTLIAVAQSARVVITTVGPYVLYGDALVAACASAGTDYVDLTGEPEFVDNTYVRHHATAVHTGARIVHACGFDSVPHDLGAYFTVQQLPIDTPLRLSGYVKVSAAFSGGTFHSAVTAMTRPRQNVAAARARRASEPAAVRSARYVVGKPHRDPVNSGCALPMPTVDGHVVARSARAIARYGPDFQYSHFLSVAHLHNAAATVTGLGGVALLAQVPPTRRLLLARLAPGTGPSPQRRARSWFRVSFVGEGGGQRVVTRVSGGDPGYDETAKMLAESALCLAFDELPATAGQVTTATAMGTALLDRLQAAGLVFEVIKA
ncbi:MAG: saccharopine dehydrogenase NADP-binding domain-containing protein [Actinomycetota bacterium]|nr:saccharopine dehydrogenase NADP-binding domain-containing protein [Actinomycetota bacterium]